MRRALLLALLVGSAHATDWPTTCASTPLPSAPAKTIYVCDCDTGTTPSSTYAKSSLCVPGDDANDGLTPSTPKRTIDLAFTDSFANSINGGDALAFCKGGRFLLKSNGTAGAITDQYGTFKNARCSAGSPCYIRDYSPPWGNGTEGGPVFVASDTNVSTFRIFGQGTHYAGIKFWNIAVVHAGGGGTGAAGSVAFNYDGWINDVEFCNDVIDGFDAAMVMGATGDVTIGGKLYDGYCGERVHVRGNRFLNNCSDALLYEAAFSDVDGNYFDMNGHDACTGYSHWGSSGPGAHAVYIATGCMTASSGNPADSIRVINNEIHRPVTCNNVSGCGAWPYGSCAAVSATGVGGSATNTLFENNWFDLPHDAASSCSAIGGGNFQGQYDLSGPRNWTIRRNRITMGGNNSAIGISSALNALIEDNLIEYNAPIGGADGVILLPHNSATHNYTNWGCNDMTGHGTVRHNTIILNNVNDALKAAVSVGNYDPTQTLTTACETCSGNTGRPTCTQQVSVPFDTAVGFNVTGNVVYVASGTLGACFAGWDKNVYGFFDNNACYAAPGATVASWWQAANIEGAVGAGPSDSLSAWRTYSGFDAASLQADPLFVSTSDFTPQSGSPLVNAGTTAATCSVLACSGSPNSCALTSAQACYSPDALSGAWSATGTAAGAVGTRDIGAFEYGTTVLLNRCVR